MGGQQTFGQSLKQHRKALNLTQPALARQVGCAVITLQKLEADERSPSRQMAERLADILSLSLAEREVFVTFARGARGAGGALAREGRAIPIPATPLLGRARDIALGRDLLLRDDVRLLTMRGPPGIGKTRLAMQLALDLQHTFADGVCYVSLALIKDPNLVVGEIAQAFGIREMVGQPLRDRLADYLRGKQLLLLLDNFEQVLRAALDVGELLAAAPHLKVLVTSRAALRLSGEHEYAVPALELPDAEQLQTPDEVARVASVELFVQRVRASDRIDFGVSEQNAAAIAAICHRLDGVPLAIELAAARARLFTPEALLARLDRRLTFLTAGNQDLPAHQETLRAAIDWSYDLLDQEVQTLFIRLGVFAGGCTVAAAEAVCIPTPNSRPSTPVLDGLAVLVDQSLLRRVEGPDGEPRFTRLETIREYAEERLAASSEAGTIRQRHAEYFLALVERARPHLRGPEQRAWLMRLDAEHDNLQAALAYCREAGDVRLGACDQNDDHTSHKPQATSLTEIGVRLATALGEFWMVHGSMIEGHMWLTAMLARVPEPTLLRARALNALGFITYEGGFGHARELFEASLAISQPLNDRPCIADALYGLGRGGLDTEDRAAPERLLESLALYRELGDKASAVRALNCLGYLVGVDADYQRGVKLCEEGLALARELGDMSARAALYHTLGSITRIHADAAQATELLQTSLDLFYDLGDQAGALFPLLGLADVAQLERDYGRAEALLNDALAQCRKVGSRRHLAWALNNLGDIVLHRGDAATAGRLFADGLALFQKFDRRNGVAQCLLGCAGVTAAQGQAARAARLCGAADALLTAYRTSIAELPPDDRMHYTLTFTAIHAQLDDTAFAAAWAEGTALTREQAITEALEGIRLGSGASRETMA